MPYRALLIGVAKYEGLPSLAGPEPEVALLRDVLLSSSPNVSVEVLFSPRLQEAEESIFELLRRADPGDSVIIYFAGHSDIERDDLYLLFADADPRNATRDGLSSASISAALERTRASSVLLILNTSYAGAFELPDSPRLKDSETAYYLIASVGPTEPARDASPFAEAIATSLASSITQDKIFGPEDVFASASDRLATWGARPFYASRGVTGLEQPGEPPLGHPIADRKSIFVSYAHKDERWLNKLRPHLESLVRDVVEIDYWDDNRIRPGEDWHQEIRDQLTVARAVTIP